MAALALIAAVLWAALFYSGVGILVWREEKPGVPAFGVQTVKVDCIYANATGLLSRPSLSWFPPGQDEYFCPHWIKLPGL